MEVEPSFCVPTFYIYQKKDFIMKHRLIFALLLLTASLYATTYTTSVADNSDDAEQEVGNHAANLTSSDLELVYDGRHKQIVGIRFRNVYIPKDASITNAYIKFQAKTSDDTVLSLKISAEANGNSEKFKAEKRNISDRTQTEDTVSWNNVQPWTKKNFYNTPNIKTLVEDVITRDDWSFNGPITFFIEQKDSKNIRRAYSKGTGRVAPELVIEYTSNTKMCQNYDGNLLDEYIDITDLPAQVSNIESAGSVIESMNNVDENRTACIYGNAEDDDYDYYYFKADVDGRLDINRSSPNGHDYGLKITTDNGYSYGTHVEQDDPITSIGMRAGESIYIRINEVGSDINQYQLNFNFKTGVNIAGDRPFTIRNPKETRDIKGNYQVAGNMNLCEDDGSGGCRDTNNNSNNRDDIYIDIDSDDSTHNSSSSTINLPANSKVVWAGLYWQGVVHRSRSEDGGHDFMGGTVSDTAPLLGGDTNQIDLSDDTYGADEIKFKTPNETEYKTIKAEQLDYSKLGYGAFADVTDLVDSNPNGSYMVADLKCHEGAEPSHGNYGAWSLVVIYKNDDEPLRNITLFDGFATIDSGYKDDLVIDGFLTPSTEPINSRIAFFTMDGEGGKNSLTIVSDTNGPKKVEHLPENPANSLFNSTVTGIDSRTPDVAPLRFDLDIIDITNYLAPLETKAVLQPRTNGDRYTASFFIMSTELYEPRVCYYIDSIVDNSNEKIFEDGKFVSDIKSDEEYTFNIWISNMKKEVTDVNLEDAENVQVYMRTKDFTYTRYSTKIQNVGETTKKIITDLSGDDKGEYSSDVNTWRVGEGANRTDGGELVPTNSFNDNTHKAFVTFKGSLDTSDASNIDLTDYLNFTASFSTPTLTITPENAKPLFQCQDLNSSVVVGGAPSGAFNVVNSSFPDANRRDPILTANSTSLERKLNAISTQVTNRTIHVKVLALDTDDDVTLKNYTGDVNISIIPTPEYDDDKDEAYNQGLCDAANTPLSTVQTFNFNDKDRIDIAFTNITSAVRNASFRIQYKNGSTSSYACSRDFFAIRPDKFILTSGTENVNLLKSGLEHNLSLKATQFNSTNATPNYTIANAQSIFPALNDDKTVYAPDGSTLTNGTLKFGVNNFNIEDGLAENVVGMSFDDVGKVNIKLMDTNWSQVDINNNDTSLDCSENGAYICGDINTTFIPDHFTITDISLNNFTEDATAHSFTYISNDSNISAGVKMSITAENGATPPKATKNFDSSAWENDVTVTLAVTSPTGVTIHKNEITSPMKLSFSNGDYNLSNTENNDSKKIGFNFDRRVDSAVNPFKIDGTAVTATVSSSYSSAGDTVTISGNSPATANATFVYGRTHATRQRFTGDKGTATIYFENYCSGSDCDKALLPDGSNSKTSDDPRWFINTKHFSAAGSVGTVTEERSSNITEEATTGTSSVNVTLKYNASKGYPYKATIENNASAWLIYNKYNNSANSNDFSVEFTNSEHKWAGLLDDAKSTTDTNTSRKTNRRTMW
jgi:hypothetical protein